MRQYFLERMYNIYSGDSCLKIYNDSEPDTPHSVRDWKSEHKIGTAACASTIWGVPPSPTNTLIQQETVKLYYSLSPESEPKLLTDAVIIIVLGKGRSNLEYIFKGHPSLNHA